MEAHQQSQQFREKVEIVKGYNFDLLFFVMTCQVDIILFYYYRNERFKTWGHKLMICMKKENGESFSRMIYIRFSLLEVSSYILILFT